MSDRPVPERIAFNLDEGAALVGLKPPTLRRAIREGKLIASKPGRAYIVTWTNLNAWVQSEARRGGRLIAKPRAGAA